MITTIPERDEELEKFIDTMVEAQKMDLVDRAALQCVAAFSARRAREKAIEECLAEVPEQKDKGDDEFATGYYKAFNDIHAYIASLKTK
jgi:hypothetical protein